MSGSLLSSITRYIADSNSGSFDDLALALFRRQYKENAAYRRYVDNSIGDAIGVVRCADIPAVPAQAFKAVTLSCRAESDCIAVFHSSGTTQANAGKHWLDPDGLRLYEASLIEGFSGIARYLPSEYSLWAMMPPASDAPHSSLSHMLATLKADRWFWDDLPALNDSLSSLTSPIALFGTGFAFVSLFDAYPGKRWPLPLGSVVINTGGFKGRTREVDRDAFYDAMRDAFEVGDEACLAEYGMSEMASQFYAAGVAGPFLAPHWLRWRIIDPITGVDAYEGEPGLLRVYDLANYNSVLAIQTQDRAVAHSGGFRLLGRDPGVEVRGCSLTVEDLWNREL